MSSRQRAMRTSSLADDIESGFDLVGDAPKSSVLPAKVVPASTGPWETC